MAEYGDDEGPLFTELNTLQQESTEHGEEDSDEFNPVELFKEPHKRKRWPPALQKVFYYMNVIRWISRYPIISLVVLMTVPIVMSIVGLLFPVQVDFGIDGFRVRDNEVGSNYDALTAGIYEKNQYPLPSTAKRSTAYDNAHDHAYLYDLYHHNDDNNNNYNNLVGATTATTVAERSQRQWKLQVIFMSKSSNILDVQQLEYAHDIYRTIMTTPGYTDYCQLPILPPPGPTPLSYCQRPQSLMPLLFPTVRADGTASLTGDADHIIDLKKAILTALAAGIYFYTDSTLSVNNLVSKTFRVEFDFGAPLPGFSSPSDREDEQRAMYQNFVVKYESLFESVNKNSSSPFTIYYGGDVITEYQIQKTVFTDAFFALGSLLLILVLMRIHMGSFFLATAGLLQIIISFPATYFIYRVILQVEYVGLLNAISLFLITGVGVDDVFVFYDVFCQANIELPLQNRLSFTYKKASKATFVTSMTTAAAFVTNITSQIPALRLFGIFMAMIVCINWLLVIGVFPAVLAVWDTRLRGKTYCRNSKYKIKLKIANTLGQIVTLPAFLIPSDPTKESEVHQSLLNEGTDDKSNFSIDEPDHSNINSEASDQDPLEHDATTVTIPKSPVNTTTYRKIDLFFRNQVSSVLFRFRYAFLALFLAMVAVGGWQASLLRPAQSAPAFFPPGSNIQRFLDWQQSSYFTGGSWYFTPNIVYGCDFILNSAKTEDLCGVCGGDNSTCAGCDGKPNSGKIYDYCGICGGDGSSCRPPPTSATSYSTSTGGGLSTSSSTSARPATTTSSSISTTSKATSSSTSAKSTTGATPMTSATSTVALSTSTSTSAATLSSATSTTSSTAATSAKPTTSTTSKTSTTTSKTSTTLATSSTTAKPATATSTTSASTTYSASTATLSTSVSASTATSATAASTTTTSAAASTPATSATAATSAASTSATSASATATTAATAISTAATSTVATSTSAASTAATSTSAAATMSSTTTTGPCVSFDFCGVCGGNNSTCRSGCDNEPNSKKTFDMCDVCGGDNSTCTGCDGVIGSGKVLDVCHVCGGNNTCIGPPPISSNLVTLNLVWGIVGIDRSKADVNDPFSEYVGDAIYDPNFDLSDPESQLHIYNTISWLGNQSDLTVSRNGAIAGSSIITEFAKYLGAQFPLPKENFYAIFTEWVRNKNKWGDLGYTVDGSTITYKWIKSSFKINLAESTSSFEAIKVFDKWNAAVAKINENTPKSLGKAFQTSDEWMRVVTEVVAVDNIVKGLVVSTTVAVVGALLFTHNVIIAALIFLVLMGTIVSSLAFFRIMGWELGIVEAISIAVLVGLSVDYCLHLGDAYTHSTAKPGLRHPRTRDALTAMGTSVVGGAATTIGSSIMLLFCTIQIFTKFGLIVTVNTAFSILLTVFVFCPLLMVAGPQHDHGNLYKYALKLFKKQL